MKPFVNWNEPRKTKSNFTKRDSFQKDLQSLIDQQNMIMTVLQRQSNIKKLKRPLRWVKEKKTIQINNRYNNYDTPKTKNTFEWNSFVDNLSQKNINYWQHPKKNKKSISTNKKLQNFIKTLWLLICILILIIVILFLGITFK